MLLALAHRLDVLPTCLAVEFACEGVLHDVAPLEVLALVGDGKHEVFGELLGCVAYMEPGQKDVGRPHVLIVKPEDPGLAQLFQR